MSRCEVCGKGPATEHGGVAVYRQNRAWRCEQHNEQPVDPEMWKILKKFCLEEDGK